MVELYIIRHGQAGKSLSNKTKDFVRPLTKKGRDELKDIGKGLKKMKIHFDIILTSPLLRAKETAEIINAYCGSQEEVSVTNFLEPGASYDELIQFLNKLNSYEKVAIVGHEPFLSGFASYCISQSNYSILNLKKGGALKMDIDNEIIPGRCILSWLLEPEQIICPKK